MRRRPILRLLAATTMIPVVFAAAACSSGASAPDEAESRRSSAPTVTAAPATATPANESRAAAPTSTPVEGAVVRFSTTEASVDVMISADNAATRDFLSMLPLTLSFSDFAGREKVADLPRGLDRDGVPGSDPEDGDLISYIPWSNLAFYYDASGIGFDENVIRLATTNATLAELEGLESGPVTIDRVETAHPPTPR